MRRSNESIDLEHNHTEECCIGCAAPVCICRSIPHLYIMVSISFFAFHVAVMTRSELRTQLGLIPHPEGGCFLETFRSGSTPMSSRGQTDLNVPERDLVHCPVRSVADVFDCESASLSPSLLLTRTHHHTLMTSMLFLTDT